MSAREAIATRIVQLGGKGMPDGLGGGGCGSAGGLGGGAPLALPALFAMALRRRRAGR